MKLNIEVDLAPDLERKFLAIHQKCFSRCVNDHSLEAQAKILLEMAINDYFERIVQGRQV
jgi:hypothetical protein